MAFGGHEMSFRGEQSRRCKHGMVAARSCGEAEGEGEWEGEWEGADAHGRGAERLSFEMMALPADNPPPSIPPDSKVLSASGEAAGSAQEGGARQSDAEASSSGRTTTTALLESLKDAGNAPIWEAFDGRYRPILQGFAMKLGLSAEDAADVAQQALGEFVRDYRSGLYHRGKGRLSSWLISIARNRAIDLQRVQGRKRGWRGESAFEQVAQGGNLLQGSSGDDAHWEAERQHAILARALARLRETSKMSEHTIRAFELVAIRGVTAEAAARECGISIDEVYVAKNRVTKQLRELVVQISADYDDE